MISGPRPPFHRPRSVAQYTFLQAPHPLSGPLPFDVEGRFEGPYFEWWSLGADTDGRFYAVGAEESLDLIAKTMREQGPFDGLVGFSQGAAAAAIVAGCIGLGDPAEEGGDGGKASGGSAPPPPSSSSTASQIDHVPTPPLLPRAETEGFGPTWRWRGVAKPRFVLLFAGVRMTRQYAYAYSGLRNLPSLHVLGDRDPVRRQTLELIASFDDPLVVHHPRGHSIPRLPPPDLQVVRAFLERYGRREKPDWGKDSGNVTAKL